MMYCGGRGQWRLLTWAIIAMGVGWWWASLLLVLGGGGSSPHLRVLVDLLGLVTWPSDGVLWRSWVVAAMDGGHLRRGCGVVMSPHCRWCWGNSDMAVGTGVVDSGGG